MKFLSLEFIKLHSRIDFDCDDDLLEMYADSAEDTVAQYTGRGKNAEELVASLTADFGKIPAPVFHAALELVDQSYNHRALSSPTQMYAVPYNFDLLIKPYMKL